MYESAEGVSAAMKQGSSGQLVQYDLPVQDSSSPVGLKAWVAQHKAARPGNDALQKQVGTGFIVMDRLYVRVSVSTRCECVVSSRLQFSSRSSL